MNKLKLSTKILSLFVLAGLFSCSNDDSEPTSTGQASIKVTDAAVDAENVSGVYLSVSEIQATANGQTRTVVSFDTPNEFNLMAYQNGQTYFMGQGDLEAGTYSDIRFITSTAANSYVEFKDGSTKQLDVENGATTGYAIQGTFEVTANATTDLVADIDLRKAFTTANDGSFRLRSTARVVVEGNAGIIQGTVSGAMDASAQTVVYAYTNGSFSASEEDAPADGSTRFEGSINSAVVASDGSYTLAFMEEGEYEIIVASYNNEDEDDDLEFQGRLNSSLMLDALILESVSVTASATASVNILIN